MPPSVATYETEYRSPPVALVADYAGTCSGDYRFLDENGGRSEGLAPPIQGTDRTYTIHEHFRVLELAPSRCIEASTSVPRARTPLGRRLLEIRSRIVASGIRLRDWNDIDRELADRRGGVE